MPKPCDFPTCTSPSLDDLPDDGWRTPDTYFNFFDTLPDAPGVYMLEWFDTSSIPHFRDLGIAYVGQAVNVKLRLSKHDVLRKLLRAPDVYVRRWFKKFPRERLKEIERSLIRHYDPPFNVIGRPRGFQ